MLKSYDRQKKVKTPFQNFNIIIIEWSDIDHVKRKNVLSISFRSECSLDSVFYRFRFYYLIELFNSLSSMLQSPINGNKIACKFNNCKNCLNENWNVHTNIHIRWEYIRIRCPLTGIPWTCKKSVHIFNQLVWIVMSSKATRNNSLLLFSFFLCFVIMIIFSLHALWSATNFRMFCHLICCEIAQWL